MWPGPTAAAFATYFRRFDPQGTPLGAPAVTPTPPAHFVIGAPALAMAQDGRLVVAWTEEDVLRRVRARLRPGHRPVGQALVTANQTGAVASWAGGRRSSRPPRASGIACDGSFIIAWTEIGLAFAPCVRRFDPAGVASGRSRRTARGPSPTCRQPVAVEPDGGEHVVGWVDDGQLFEGAARVAQ
ncbi:MAG: hypothetical protein R3F59_25855 [Myxococcota bacterium]